MSLVTKSRSYLFEEYNVANETHTLVNCPICWGYITSLHVNNIMSYCEPALKITSVHKVYIKCTTYNSLSGVSMVIRSLYDPVSIMLTAAT